MEKSGYLTSGIRGEKLRSNIFFIDESWIELHRQSQSQNRRFRTENRKDVPHVQVPKFDFKILAAGGFCAGGVFKLHFVPKNQTITAAYYQEHILPVYFEAMKRSIFSSKKNLAFQQDGARPHTAKSTMKILEDDVQTVCGKYVWPGIIPDLNP